MNNLDTILYLANAEAKHYAPLRLDVILEENIPRLIVKKKGDTYDVDIQGHQGHDNEGRATTVVDFVKRAILNNVDRKIDATGVYPIELHDSYTYLDSKDSTKYKGCLTFSKNMKHRHTINFPDPYQMGAYGGMLGIEDTVSFADKKNAVLFAGTTTGSKDVSKNARIEACKWALDKRPQYEFLITQVAQIPENEIVANLGQDVWGKIKSKPIPHTDHFKYKYVFNVQGNTCGWSRVPMILNSKSLMINWSHDDGTWYYPLLQENNQFVSVNNLNQLPSVVNFLDSNPGIVQLMTNNANRFVKQYCGQIHAAYYGKCLFEAMAANK